jgi:hypothetical protein
MAAAIIGSLLPTVANVGKKVASALIAKAKSKVIEKGKQLAVKGAGLAAKGALIGASKLAEHWSTKEDKKKQFMDLLESIKEVQDSHKGPKISILASTLKPYISKYAGEVIPRDKVDAVMEKLPDGTKIELIERGIEEEALAEGTSTEIEKVIDDAENKL